MTLSRDLKSDRDSNADRNWQPSSRPSICNNFAASTRVFSLTLSPYRCSVTPRALVCAVKRDLLSCRYMWHHLSPPSRLLLSVERLFHIEGMTKHVTPRFCKFALTRGIRPFLVSPWVFPLSLLTNLEREKTLEELFDVLVMPLPFPRRSCSAVISSARLTMSPQRSALINKQDSGPG